MDSCNGLCYSKLYYAPDYIIDGSPVAPAPAPPITFGFTESHGCSTKKEEDCIRKYYGFTSTTGAACVTLDGVGWQEIRQGLKDCKKSSESRDLPSNFEVKKGTGKPFKVTPHKEVLDMLRKKGRSTICYCDTDECNQKIEHVSVTQPPEKFRVPIPAPRDSGKAKIGNGLLPFLVIVLIGAAASENLTWSVGLPFLN